MRHQGACPNPANMAALRGRSAPHPAAPHRATRTTALVVACTHTVHGTWSLMHIRSLSITVLAELTLIGWLVDWLVVCLYWAFARAKALASVGIGRRERRLKARVVGVSRGRGRYGALLVDLVCPADVGHIVCECSNARRSATMACHSRARAPDRQNKERIC